MEKETGLIAKYYGGDTEILWAGFVLIASMFGCDGVAADAPEGPEQTGSLSQAITTTCNYPQWSIPPVTDEIDMAGSQARFKLGINRDFGGVGVDLRLINRAYPTAEVGVLEGRSAAGSGFQFTQFSHLGSTAVITNQAAGNTVGYQWGKGSNVSKECGATNCYINATEDTPVYRDTVNGVGQSPCDGTSAAFDTARFNMGAQPIAVPGGGTAITFSHNYTVKSSVNQYWTQTRAVIANYYRRRTAHDGNLRMYVKGRSGWTLGPIYLAEGWTAANLKDTSGTERAKMLSMTDWTGSWSEFTDPVSSIVLVWNIIGQDIGITVKNLQDGAAFRMAENVYCADTANYECGSIDLAPYQRHVNNASYPVGDVRESQFDYVIGSVPQLRNLGYWIP